MKPYWLALMGVSTLAVVACGGGKSSADAAEADAEAAMTTSAAAQDTMEDEGATGDTDPFAAVSSGTYVLEPTHAYVVFQYDHLGYSRPVIGFTDFDATVELDKETPTNSSLTVTIDPASIDSGVEDFDEHLVSADMFDVETYPEISFTSTSIELDTPTTGTLTGDLTMKGVTKPVTLDVTLNGAGVHPRSELDHFGISARGTLMRDEWNLGYATPAVGNEVELIIETEFNRPE
ncbi:putative secreted protein [Parvularcula bermudensis HTCC2503]|uniref:Putative secreted protein n=1 Tax=Parvularcula bermudensis (strain ATCC BAA-594 / HTCC2503 / KCTC 12087) TaxID=314260 RepID=E0TFT3_PARBH|nr:YceI family protein [Parvularcula bermudensis]ADM09098.1 putative secreted protein [Parvularcula bermudensis HTCC2503]